MCLIEDGNVVIGEFVDIDIVVVFVKVYIYVLNCLYVWCSKMGEGVDVWEVFYKDMV